ncbi:elongation factor G [Pontixanthobacter gangjinensis]|uniref:Elongation factor G n=1 Tax=Christiangramia aestuarii TaxID=1028746 RepID=A0A7K1LPW5_9FLAO|nr:elongation factor G [Christiangramia aestuarii]MUP42788.1 elongation factor G [Christiangramia aestuarii]
MKVFDEKHIKNVVFVGAHNSGKTTLAETMLFEAGLINRRGSVEAGNTVSDHHEIEHEKGNSIFATPLHTEWRNYKINIIDTPGLDDFIGEVISSIRVADTIVTLINGQHGVEVGSEIIWNYIDRYRKPTLFVINQIDHPGLNFEESLNSIRNLVGNNAVQIQYPLKKDGAQCIIDVLKMKMYKFPPEGGKPEKLEIPEDQKEKAEHLHNELVEKAAENDEELMESFFENSSLTEDEMRKGIKTGMINHELFPVFCISALNDMGSGRLMGFIDNVCPSASDVKLGQSLNGEDINPVSNEPAVLFVFKTVHQPNLGQLSFFKVKRGEVRLNDKLINSRTGETETLNQLFIMDGKERLSVSRLSVGDIGATLKLKSTETNDSLYSSEQETIIRPIEYPQPRFSKAISAVNNKDEEKLSEALKKIHSQDPTVEISYSKEGKQLIVGCQGELHLAIVEWTLNKIYGVEVSFDKPKIAFRETIQRSANANYRHKKQSGGSGQFAQVHLKIEPWEEGMAEPEGFNIRGKEEVDLPWGGKLFFYNCIVGGAIDQRYLPSIMKGILEVMEQGPLTGSYIRDVRVMVYDGKMHSVDSNDISFKIAGAHAFKEAFLNANPKLLEPTLELIVKVPEEMVGNVMTDLQSRRAIIQGIESNASYQVLKCIAPEAELYGYSTDLRSLTQGRATFRSSFSTYQPVPANVQKELVKTE